MNPNKDWREGPDRDDHLGRLIGELPRAHVPDRAVEGLHRLIGQKTGKSRRGRRFFPVPAGPALARLVTRLLRVRSAPGKAGRPLLKPVTAAVLITLALSVPATLAARRLLAKPEGTTFVVRFVYENPGARSVHLAGDFTGWSTDEIPMQRVPGTGVWTADVTLSGGVYRYLFLVDEHMWETDPSSGITVRDEFGHENSLIVLLEDGGKETGL